MPIHFGGPWQKNQVVVTSREANKALNVAIASTGSAFNLPVACGPCNRCTACLLAAASAICITLTLVGPTHGAMMPGSLNVAATLGACTVSGSSGQAGGAATNGGHVGGSGTAPTGLQATVRR